MEEDRNPQEESAKQDAPAAEPSITHAMEVKPETPVKRRPKINIFAGKEKYELIILFLIILCIGTAAFYFGKYSKHDKPASVKTTPVAVATPGAASATTPDLPAAEFLSGNTYFDSPQKLSDLAFFKDYKTLGCDSNCVDDLKISYFQIGTTAKGQRILVMTYLSGPGGDGYLYALETKPGIYSLLAQNSFESANYASDWQPSLNSNSSFDDKTKLDDITMPLQLSVAGQKMKVQFAPNGAKNISMHYMNLMKSGLSSIRGGYFSDVAPSAIKKLGSQDGIDFYEVIAKDTDNYQAVEYHAAYKKLFSASYSPGGEIAAATGPLNISWMSGVDNKNNYFSAGQGCGSNGYIVAKNVAASDLIKAGTTPGGQAVYQLPQSNALVQEVYDKDYAKGEFVEDSSLKNLSLDDFTKQHGYFLIKNGLGENVVFLREDLIIHGGCAKPVIYLYPQYKQQVSVEVGARVVNSSPAYNGGWKDVQAYPDGSLSYKGQVFDSLFWDGYGFGPYPDVTSGTIVKSKDATSTIKQQLALQGINAKETSDFLDYWQPKISGVTQPYVRLTWFGTSQMNSLAPLRISPQPQTLIRVFLDFEGLDKPYAIQPQKLQAPDRHGFTVVEWGGLARYGLNH